MPTAMHKAQSMVLTGACTVPSLSEITTLTKPPEVHTKSMDLGDTQEDAAAIPRDKTNQTSKKRGKNLSVRKISMAIAALNLSMLMVLRLFGFFCVRK